LKRDEPLDSIRVEANQSKMATINVLKDDQSNAITFKPEIDPTGASKRALLRSPLVRYSVSCLIALILLASLVKATSDSAESLPVPMALESEPEIRPLLTDRFRANDHFHPESDSYPENELSADPASDNSNHGQSGASLATVAAMSSLGKRGDGWPNCNRELDNMTIKSRTPGDNGFKIKITGNPEKYTPGELYTGNCFVFVFCILSEHFVACKRLCHLSAHHHHHHRQHLLV
jgi:hypothetical protein